MKKYEEDLVIFRKQKDDIERKLNKQISELSNELDNYKTNNEK
jgi:hypothetical protein